MIFFWGGVRHLDEAIRSSAQGVLACPTITIDASRRTQSLQPSPGFINNTCGEIVPAPDAETAALECCDSNGFSGTSCSQGGSIQSSKTQHEWKSEQSEDISLPPPILYYTPRPEDLSARSARSATSVPTPERTGGVGSGCGRRGPDAHAENRRLQVRL